jgi:hypothetical protein
VIPTKPIASVNEPFFADPIIPRLEPIIRAIMTSRPWKLFVLTWLAALTGGSKITAQDSWRHLEIRNDITSVQPMTGIVLWETNEAVDSAPVQLEYAYLSYAQIIQGPGDYNWTALDSLLERIAKRKHQAIVRWYDTYVGQSSGVPQHIQSQPGYRGITAKSEGKNTGFPDWSNEEWQSCVLDFLTAFAAKYDRDPRLAFVQLGFGLWSEYHIYDGPMELGKTFPSLQYQTRFLEHASLAFRHTPWMISVDAAGEHTPIANTPSLLALPFGLFDDSFNHRRHAEENEPNWNALGRERWERAPAGGEFSFFETRDQRRALDRNGPHGTPFEVHAAKFHISFMIGDDQLRFQSADRVRAAGLACGYRFRVVEFKASSERCRVSIRNDGIAPMYHDAFPCIDGARATDSLKGLQPGAAKSFEFNRRSDAPRLTIESDRLVPGQSIDFEADLDGQ